ncbi:MAG: hypothetical protein E4H03_07275 [Myxococcales bacterium]|jgi:septal ring factor EnvC (AmiA/AmiB activator)|nr:MAG: hypothetical protein E4H03_07275 [Myxococcales bacterium]
MIGSRPTIAVRPGRLVLLVPVVIVFVFLQLSLPRGIASAQEPEGDVHKRLGDVIKNREEAAARTAERAERERDLLAEVTSTDRKLLSAARKREALREEDAALEEEYELHLERIELIQSEYDRARSLLSQRLASIYKRGRLGNNRSLLQAAASSEPLRMARYLAAVSRADTNALDDYETVRRRHETAIGELDVQRLTIAAKKADFEQEQARYERAREEKTILLARLEKDTEADRLRQGELLAVETELRRILEASNAEIEGEAADDDAAAAGEDRNDDALGETAREKDRGADVAVGGSTNRGRPEFHARTTRPKHGKTGELFPDLKGTLQVPVHGDVLSRYGEKRSSGHVVQGVLVRAGKDTQVASVAGGEIVFSGPFPGLGKTIIISHGDRYHTVYAHLDVLQHEVGERVRENEIVGSLPHSEPVLHFELRAEGKAVDPGGWFGGGYSAFAR